MRLKPYYPIPLAAAILLAFSGQIVAAPPGSPTEIQFLPANQPGESPLATAVASVADEETDSEPGTDAQGAEVHELAETFEDFVDPADSYSAPYLSYEDVPYSPRTAVRFGWWGVDVDGSNANVGEWQGLDSSSPFWDVDGLRSNGFQTVDFFATGTENETTTGGLYFYGGPRLTANFEYDRFLHRLGHKPLGGTLLPYTPGDFPLEGGFFDPPPPTPHNNTNSPGFVMWGEDLGSDRDYALRVQQVKANFRGDLTENLKWRLNVWGMKKEGTRQVNATQHCFNATSDPASPVNGACHVVSRSQNIDWLTMEIEPVIEARFGWLTVEYSRTMRTFEQSDQIVTNNFSRGTSSLGLGSNAQNGAYAYVPENITEIDRLKLRGQLAPQTDLYVVSHLGNTHNKFRESDRKFYGVDARLTNTSVDGLSLTAYGKTFTQRNSEDTQSLNTRYPGQASLWLEQSASTLAPLPPQTFFTPDAAYYQNLVDRDEFAVGIKGRWRPFHDSCDWRRGTAVTGGYEYSQLERDNVSYLLRFMNPPVLFTQPTTVSNMFFVGVQQDWSRALNTYVRYRMIDRQWPLLGVTHRQQLDLDHAINTNQPQHEDRIEIGGNWQPVDNLMLNASFWLVNSYHHSDLVNFDEDSYPIVLSAWYAMNEQWSFTGGFATFSNWISQDITLGREDGLTTNEARSWTSPWDYTGRADVFNVGASYVVSCNLTLVGGVEYVRSRNAFADPGTPPAENQATNPAIAALPYSDLPGYSAVRVNTIRLTAGTDYHLTNNINSFFRYNFYDFDNQGWGYQSGTAHMFLAGLSGVY
ncbi:MAG: hypothetical protein KJ000_08815 [Pirellulaceae bacterium]|nr:hypothetical protein [Pirellulaceae bacterium]